MAEKTRRLGTVAPSAPDPNASKVGAYPDTNEEGFVRDQDDPILSPRHEGRGYSTYDADAHAAAVKAAESESK